jgi:hypothetical protein
MKITCAIALGLILDHGSLNAHAQAPSPAAPFVLAVTSISMGSVHVWTNNVLAFHFADARAVNVDELDQELARRGTHSERRVRIVEGTNVLVEGRLCGRAWGVRANGFMLQFATPEAALAAAAVMQEKGALVLPKQ